MRKIPCGRTEETSGYCCLRKHNRYNIKVKSYRIKIVNDHFVNSYQICCRKCGTNILIATRPGIGLFHLLKVRFINLYSI